MNKKIKILFEDSDLVCASKNSGIPVHQTRDPLRAHFQGMLENQLGLKLVLFHRLDADTSGIVVFGKNPRVNKSMTELFRQRQIKKTYHAVVGGHWNSQVLELKGHIHLSSEKTGVYEFSKHGNKTTFSKTQFKLLKKSNNTVSPRSLIQANPETGRTHQIRVHCSYLGHSICGDRLYGGEKSLRALPMALHAHGLEFEHPINGQSIRVEDPVPFYFSEWLES